MRRPPRANCGRKPQKEIANWKAFRPFMRRVKYHPGFHAGGLEEFLRRSSFDSWLSTSNRATDQLGYSSGMATSPGRCNHGDSESLTLGKNSISNQRKSCCRNSETPWPSIAGLRTSCRDLSAGLRFHLISHRA